MEHGSAIRPFFRDLIEIVVADMATYEAEVLNKLLAIPELRNIRTSFAIRSYRSGRPSAHEANERLMPQFSGHGAYL